MSNVIVNFVKDVFKKLASIFRSIMIYLAVATIILTVLGAISGGFTSESDNYVNEKVWIDEGGENKVMLIKLSGLILSDDGQSLLTANSGVIKPDQVYEILNQIKKDENVKAVIVDINSNGGSPVASDRIYEIVENFKQETQIPVIALLGEMAASGGYYIASNSDWIVANPATITGSIGILLETYNLEGLYEKLGVSKNTFKQGEYKDIFNEAREMTEEEKAMADMLTKDSYDTFLSRVAAGRGLSEEETRAVANGKVYSGKMAKEVGLVDSLGNLDEAFYQAKNLAQIERAVLVEYDSSSFFDELFATVKSSKIPLVGTKDLFIWR
jgi:protease IV